MSSKARLLLPVVWTVIAVLFAVAAIRLIWFTPVESTMGHVQMIFYLHLPVAINTFVAAMIVFIASVGYLWQRKLWWDDLAAAAGKVTAIYCAVVLLTGMTWARSAWGHWWTWSPRLTFSLVLFLLYVVYVMIRPSIESPQRRAMVSSVFGIAAFIDVPLVYLSVRLLPDIHPESISLAPEMRTTLLIWSVPVTLLLGALIATRFTLHMRERSLRRANAHLPVGAIAAT